jgi:hypothetical protein
VPVGTVRLIIGRQGSMKPGWSISRSYRQRACNASPRPALGHLRCSKSATSGLMQRNKLHAHSIISSVRASDVARRVKRERLRVLSLITSSYLVGACTARSASPNHAAWCDRDRSTLCVCSYFLCRVCDSHHIVALVTCHGDCLAAISRSSRYNNPVPIRQSSLRGTSRYGISLLVPVPVGSDIAEGLE